MQLRVQFNRLLEEYRPGRIVRFRPNGLPNVKLPLEERINSLDERYSLCRKGRGRKRGSRKDAKTRRCKGKRLDVSHRVTERDKNEFGASVRSAAAFLTLWICASVRTRFARLAGPLLIAPFSPVVGQAVPDEVMSGDSIVRQTVGPLHPDFQESGTA